MKKRLIEIQSRAIEVREKLSYDNLEERKLITKLDMIIRGTTYVKWMLLVSLAIFMMILIGGVVLFYPSIEFMLVFSFLAVIGCAVCWFAVVIQAKLYERTINKTQQILASD